MNHYEGLPPFPEILKCSFCGKDKPRMTIKQHSSGAILNLCFHGCQHFPEPYKATGLSDEWTRIDPWIKKRPQPRLRHKRVRT